MPVFARVTKTEPLELSPNSETYLRKKVGRGLRKWFSGIGVTAEEEHRNRVNQAHEELKEQEALLSNLHLVANAEDGELQFHNFVGAATKYSLAVGDYHDFNEELKAKARDVEAAVAEDRTHEIPPQDRHALKAWIGGRNGINKRLSRLQDHVDEHLEHVEALEEALPKIEAQKQLHLAMVEAIKHYHEGHEQFRIAVHGEPAT